MATHTLTVIGSKLASRDTNGYTASRGKLATAPTGCSYSYVAPWKLGEV